MRVRPPHPATVSTSAVAGACTCVLRAGAALTVARACAHLAFVREPPREVRTRARPLLCACARILVCAWVCDCASRVRFVQCCFTINPKRLFEQATFGSFSSSPYSVLCLTTSRPYAFCRHFDAVHCISVCFVVTDVRYSVVRRSRRLQFAPARYITRIARVVHDQIVVAVVVLPPSSHCAAVL